MLPWTGERYLPWRNDPPTSYEHWHRYAYTARLGRRKRVLDLASGEGYGSALLATTAHSVVGIDIDEKSVQHARAKYPGDNLHFIVGSVTELPIHGLGFDVIACFEAIEHIRECEKLLSEVKRILAPEGLLVISTPNKPEYQIIEPSNPFHLRELDFEEFRALLSQYFKQVQFLGQRIYCGSSLWPVSHQPSDRISEYLLDRDSSGFFLAKGDSRVPLYFIGVASDADPGDLTATVLVDSSNSMLKEAERVQNETAAKVQTLEEALAWREEQLRQSKAAISSQEEALAWRESQISDHLRAMQFIRGELDRIQKENDRLVGENNQLEIKVYTYESSRAGRLVQTILRTRDWLFPPGSRRRALYEHLAGRTKP